MKRLMNNPTTGSAASGCIVVNRENPRRPVYFHARSCCACKIGSHTGARNFQPQCGQVTDRHSTVTSDPNKVAQRSHENL